MASPTTLHADGYRNIMTLRGDPPKGQTEFVRLQADGLRYGSDLVGTAQGAPPGLLPRCRRLPGEASRGVVARGRSGQHQAQGRRRRGVRDDPALFRQRRVFPLRGKMPLARHHGPDRARHHARAVASSRSSASPRCAGPRCRQKLIKRLEAGGGVTGCR